MNGDKPLDCLVIGGGPAGLTAAIYLARFHLDILVIDEGKSRAGWIPCTRNVSGFPDGIKGTELLERMREQAQKYGAKIIDGTVSRLEREEGFKLVWYRTGPKALQSNLLPYVVEVVAADKPGILFQLADFFDKQGITIESLHSSRYRAMQTGAEMFTAQVTVGIPSNMHIAALRDDFMEFCDHLNLDAIMDPMKF